VGSASQEPQLGYDRCKLRGKNGSLMLHVDQAPRYRMTAAPLAQALAQVNFPVVPRLQTLEGVAPLQEHLADLFPYLNQQVVQQVDFMVGPAGPAAGSAQATTFNIFTNDDGWMLQVSVGSATLSVDGANYLGVGVFRERLERVWTALTQAAGVRRCDRLGVRYVDLIELGDEDWSRWFQPEIVGLTNPALSAGVLASSLTETRLRKERPGGTPGNASAVEGVIRHGLVPQGSLMEGIPPRQILKPSFIFDMDIFVNAPGPFNPEVLGELFSQLHLELEKVFHWAVTDVGRQHFGYERLDEDGSAT